MLALGVFAAWEMLPFVLMIREEGNTDDLVMRLGGDALSSLFGSPESGLKLV
jgi:hypothetical protein